jgi:hypothetical protein
MKLDFVNAFTKIQDPVLNGSGVVTTTRARAADYY